MPEDLVAAVVRVLTAWQWDERPAGVISIPSRSRPELIGSLAGQIAKIGRMPWLGSLEYADAGLASAGKQHNSAQRLRGMWDALVVPDSVKAELGRIGGPVLLIDDQIDTGWTLTVAAMRLRAAGAAGVLPLVLAAATA